MSLYHTTIKSFGYAWQGIKTAYKNEPNLTIHTSIAAAAMTLGVILKIDRLEWLILGFTIFFVIILELLNTLLEALVDLVSPEITPNAKVAKDVAASMVLIAAVFSVIVGIVLFVPKIIPYLKFFS